MVSNYCRPADAKWHVYCQYDALTYLVSSILTLFQRKMFSLSASNEPILWWILTNWFAQKLRFAVLWEKKKWNTLLPLTQWVQTYLWVHSRSSIRNDFTIFKPDRYVELVTNVVVVIVVLIYSVVSIKQAEVLSELGVEFRVGNCFIY